TTEQRHLLVEIREGLTWLWHQPLIRYMAFLTGGLNFVGSASFLVIIILAKNQHAPPAVIGVLFAIASAGALVGSLVGPWIQKRFAYAQVIITSVWTQVILWPLFAISPNPVV